MTEFVVFWVVAPCNVVEGSTFWRTVLSPSSGLKCWRWRQHSLPKH